MPETSKTAKTQPRKAGHRWNHELDVIGLRFRWKKENRAVLASMVSKGSIGGIRIERDPCGSHSEVKGRHEDENALAVFLPRRLFDGKQLGYVRAKSAVVLAPKLDSGALEVVSATLLNLDEDGQHPWNTGTMLVVFRDVPRKVPAKK